MGTQSLVAATPYLIEQNYATTALNNTKCGRNWCAAAVPNLKIMPVGNTWKAMRLSGSKTIACQTSRPSPRGLRPRTGWSHAGERIPSRRGVL